MIVFETRLRKSFPGGGLLVLLLSGCGPSQCLPGSGHAMQIYNLYFGRSVPGRAEVTDKEWRDFRDLIITSELPNGYTVLDGQGAWMSPRSRATISETTKILVVALPDGQESLNTVNRIRSVWQHRFDQYMVGMIVQSGCGSFLPAEAPP
jgi:hypothetical protein